MTDERIQNAAEELFNELSDIDGVETSLEEVIEHIEAQVEYMVPLDEAVRASKNKILDANGADEQGSSPEVDIGDLDEDLGDDVWVTIEGEILQLWEADHESILQTGLIGDDSGKTKFTLWASSFEDEQFEEGDTVVLEDVVTDEFNGRYSVNINKQTTIGESDVESFESPDPTVSGALVAIRSGSGLVKRCPDEDCTRVLNSGRCSEHGEVDGEFDLRIKGVLDDGEETQNVLFDREMTEELGGLSLEEATEMAMDALDTDVVESHLEDELLGRYFEVQGPQFGDNLLVNEVSDAETPAVEDLLVQGRTMQAEVTSNEPASAD
jgi:replication factor A1